MRSNKHLGAGAAEGVSYAAPVPPVPLWPSPSSSSRRTKNGVSAQPVSARPVLRDAPNVARLPVVSARRALLVRTLGKATVLNPSNLLNPLIFPRIPRPQAAKDVGLPARAVQPPHAERVPVPRRTMKPTPIRGRLGGQHASRGRHVVPMPPMMSLARRTRPVALGQTVLRTWTLRSRLVVGARLVTRTTKAWLRRPRAVGVHPATTKAFLRNRMSTAPDVMMSGRYAR